MRETMIYLMNNPMTIYAIHCPELKAFKFGRTRIGNVAGRLKEIQCGCAVPLTVYAHCIHESSLEYIIHRRLHGFRMKGEWFSDCHETRLVADAIRRGIFYEDDGKWQWEDEDVELMLELEIEDVEAAEMQAMREESLRVMQERRAYLEAQVRETVTCVLDYEPVYDGEHCEA